MTVSERHALQSLHDQLRAISHLGDPQRFHEVNEAFHNAIYAGAHNAYLAELALATRKRVQPFRRAQFRNVGRLAKSHAEHDRIVLAIQQGDRPAATAAMRAHIDTVRKEYASYAGKS
jgi:DNA-binding GntR family transcriptional regulator